MKSNTRVLAIDYGSKRIGLAISDEMRILARPIGVVNQSLTAIDELLKIIETEGVGTVILGLPKALGGGDTEMTTEVRTFAERLFPRLENIGVAHQFYDERFSSVIAASNIRDQQLSQSKRKQKYRHDEEAARIILQEFLDLR